MWMFRENDKSKNEPSLSMWEQLNQKLSVLKAVWTLERDPVFVCKVYSEERPSSMKDSDSPFYIGINYTKNLTEKPWLKASAMGVNKLNSLS